MTEIQSDLPKDSEYPEVLANPEALDAHWYTRLRACDAPGVIGAIEIPDEMVKAERTKFYDGEVENPTFAYPHIDPQQLDKSEASLLALKQDLLREEPDKTLRNLYRWKINEDLASVRMLRQTAILADENSSEEDRARAMRRFTHYSEFVYGAPDRNVFDYVLGEFHAVGEAAQASEDEAVREAAKELVAVLPKPAAAPTYALPGPDSFAAAQADLLARHGDSFAAIDPEQSYDAEAAAEVFRGALVDIGARGWWVDPSNPDKAYMATSWQSRRQDVAPNAKYTAKRLGELLAHETFGHVVTFEVGSRSKLLLLGIGLDRHEGPEEGVATVREQTAPGNTEVKAFVNLERQLAIGLARGLDGTPRDFRGTYEVLEKWYRLKALQEGKRSYGSIARNNAFLRCRRTFRGTDCQTPGAAFTKDIGYPEHNIAVWQSVERTPVTLKLFDIGKFDRTSRRHLNSLGELGILVQHGITDEDLELIARD